MSDIYHLISTTKKSTIGISKGELISYVFEGVEIMHQKGDPGWGSTEIEMFPIVGPTKDNGYDVPTPRGIAKLDQHGILRAMPYHLDNSDAHMLRFSKTYSANTPIHNPKFPEKSTLEFLQWPYDFEFIKTFTLIGDSLQVTFQIVSPIGMPQMLGFHPAFKIYDQHIKINSNAKEHTLQDVLSVGSAALLVKDCQEIEVLNNGKLDLKITTKGFLHTMLWAEVTNMVCIEPITFYPASESVSDLYKGFREGTGNDMYEVLIAPRLV